MTANLSSVDDASYIDIDDFASNFITPADSFITVGRGNALLKADQQRRQAANALQSLLDQAPRLRGRLRSHLQKALQADPNECGLSDGENQITLLDFSARLLSSAVFGNPFVSWATWGFADNSTYATWTGRDWIQALNPLLVPLRSDSDSAYWDGRMPGYAVSRRAHTEQHLREHFCGTIKLNYGLDLINRKALQLGQLDSTTLYAQLQWNHPSAPAEICPTALLISPTTDDMSRLLYRPNANNPVRAFRDRAALQSWSHEHRNLLWPNPVTALESDSDSSCIVAQDLSADGFTSLLQSILKDRDRLTEMHLQEAAQENALGPFDWSRIDAWEAKGNVQLKVELPHNLKEQLDLRVSADDSLATEEVHFDVLDERLPLGWRKQRIERQETLLADFLGDENEPTSAKMAQLREFQSKLDQEDAAMQKLLAALPETLDSQTWGQTYGETSRFEQLSQHFSQGLLLEARFQHLLGDLSPTHLKWVENIIEKPTPSFQRPTMTHALKLVVGQHAWKLTGYLALNAVDDGDGEDSDNAWLLHKSGDDGGLSVYTDQAQLTNALLKTLYGAWPETLLESAWPQGTEELLKHLDSTNELPTIVMVPITTHVFDYLTQTQLALFTSSPSVTPGTLRQRLGVSTNMARIQALERAAERNRTAYIHKKLQPLAHLDDPQRLALSKEIEAFRSSMLLSQQLLARDLPERGLFARNQLHDYLGQSYSLTTLPNIALDIADFTTKQRVLIPESGVANAYKDVIDFSKKRSNIPLEKFLLWALDDDLTLRLGNARIHFDDTAPAEMREKLNLSSIANMVKKLDLAEAYEQQIRNTFKGVKEETAWEAQLREEILRAPFEHQISIICLSNSTTLDTEGQQLLERFCQEQRNAALTRTVNYYTLELMPGVAADGSSNRVDLSGLFILKGMSGPVLLLLPGAPNDKVISQHNNTEDACRALENMAISEKMRAYLSDQPLLGEPDKHLSYINTAVLQKYTGFIGLGTSRQEPLAQFQANLQMGRLLLEHRASSRSQRDLFLEQEAIRHGRVYDYIKLAFGLVPLVGSAIALYDGWNAANSSVEAFLRGDAREGVEHLNSVFQSLVDALLDLTPGLLAGNSKALARTVSRQRQLPTGVPGTTVTRRKHSDPFIGYESPAPAGRWTDHPQAYGTGALRHTESGSDYIARNGRFYQVEWDATYRTWRLKGTSSRTYKQPVKLSEAGVWQTHGSLSGQIIDNGLAGGGAYLGTLYNRGWQTLRGYLRPQPALLSPVEVVNSIQTSLQALQARLNVKIDALNKARGLAPNAPQGRPADAATIKRALQEAIKLLDEFVSLHEESLDRLQMIRSQIGPAPFRAMYDELASNLGRQHPKLIHQRHVYMNDCFHKLNTHTHTADGVTTHPLEYLKETKSIHRELSDALAELETEVRRIGPLRNRLRGKNLTDYDQDLAALDLPLDPHGYRMVRLSSLASGIIKSPSDASYDFLLMLRRVNREILELRSALFSHADLAAASLSRSQEHRFLQQLKLQYQRFSNHLLSWKDTFPDFITTESARPMHQALTSLIKDVDNALSSSAPVKRPASTRGPSKPRLFETADEQLLIGREVNVNGQATMVINRSVNTEAHATYTAGADGKWQTASKAPAVPSANLPSVVATANKRLAGVPAQLSKLKQYQKLNMLPADLQDLAQGYAVTLKDLALDISRKAGDDLDDTLGALVQRLEQAATDLDAFGRQLRIEQIKANQQPTIGQLQYLHEQKEVSIHWSRVLEPAKNKSGTPLEYLEEYRIDDSSTNTTLWYAHFHFKRKPGSGFARLEAGHLKLASEVNQGSGAWRGPITESQATALFDGLRPNQA